MKNRRAIVVEACRKGPKLFYTWINRKGQYARHVEYRPGCLEMMTRSTIEKRLELHRNDPDALSLNICRKQGEEMVKGKAPNTAIATNDAT